jgi:hypothetical protein
MVAAVLLVAGIVRTHAQGPDQTQEPDQPKIARGELLKVDISARTIVVRTDEGQQMLFSYTDDTKVTGADRGVVGLVTMAGTYLAVQFVVKNEMNVATHIDVIKKSARLPPISWS